MLFIMGFLTDDPPALGSMEYDPSLLHVTLLNYAIVQDDELSNLVESFRMIAPIFDSIPIEVDSHVDYYGAEGDIPVRCVIGESVEKLRHMHCELTSLIHNVNGVMFSSFDFSPHVSHIDESFVSGRINHLSLVHHSSGFGKDVQNLMNIHF